MKNFYKSKKIGSIRIAINRFRKESKNIKCGEHGSVYGTGFHKWNAFSDINYSLVLGRWRVILSIDTNNGECCNLPGES